MCPVVCVCMYVVCVYVCMYVCVALPSGFPPWCLAGHQGTQLGRLRELGVIDEKSII